jgi:hypothetical protein
MQLRDAPMLTEINIEHRRYRVALTNYSNAAEVIADLSYLENLPAGELCFDFRHMTGALTQETREDFLPGSFGYQPTRQLAELAAVITELPTRQPPFSHRLTTLLPGRDSRVGRYLAGMRLGPLLRDAAVAVSTGQPANAEFGEDDTTRKNMIPLTRVTVSSAGCPDFQTVSDLRQNTEQVLRESLPSDHDLADRFTTIISEAVDNMVEYGKGGLVAGLYYPRAGEVEITLINRRGGFGGTTPGQQLEALVTACSQSTRPNGGGNGIRELSRLCLRCFGTLWLCSGAAALRFLPDGAITTDIETTGLEAAGASVTVLLQLLPSGSFAPNPTREAFEKVLRQALDSFSSRSGVGS